jgi:phage tail sheath protein FI
MPEYLAPGVYVEEVSFRSKSIEGVSTSTAAFVGPTRFGPISGIPALVTSFAEFERIYGGLDPLEFEGDALPTINYLAHGVRAFFENGGKRLYISRAWKAAATSGKGRFSFAPPSPPTSPPASLDVVARYQGFAGRMEVIFTLRVGQNILGGTAANPTLRSVGALDTVWVSGSGSPPTGTIYSLSRDSSGSLMLNPASGAAVTLASVVSTGTTVRALTVSVTVNHPGAIPLIDVFSNLATEPAHPDSLSNVFAEQLASQLASLTTPIVVDASHVNGPALLSILFPQSTLDGIGNPALGDADRRVTIRLTGGNDGALPQFADYAGDDSDAKHKTGLKAIEDIPDASIIASPGYSAGGLGAGATRALQITGSLISHCEQMRYRIAVLDAADHMGIADVRAYRGQVDSTYAAMYYPWVRVLDPLTNDEIELPPSGFVAGIYARNDIEKGVHKAPANEIVRLAISFEVLINKGQQDVLNPEGINCFRFFEGRGYRLWGARTISSDPEWKYVNLRRYFAYLERSIDRGTQFVVFENNSEPLWANVRSTIESFLLNEWQSGRLMGEKPELAYFVRCDRSTMTQNDIDNGRLICLIGVAPVRPAEFVIFRIGQITATKTN